jgi:8-oxo-dGTP pyrophosphatase MutT (NUDIX family)
MQASHAPKEKAGVVLYRQQSEDEPQMLVVSARKFQDEWVFPVGSVKKGESLAEAAKRECAEESGYQVDLGLELPSVQFLQSGTATRFTFFLATVVGELDHWETDRIRKWLPMSQVVNVLPEIFQAVARHAAAHMGPG